MGEDFLSNYLVFSSDFFLGFFVACNVCFPLAYLSVFQFGADEACFGSFKVRGRREEEMAI